VYDSSFSHSEWNISLRLAPAALSLTICLQDRAQLTVYQDSRKLIFSFSTAADGKREKKKEFTKKKRRKKSFTGRALTQPWRRHRAETFLYFGGACDIAMARGGSKWPTSRSVWGW
jgi:hypothetical protein